MSGRLKRKTRDMKRQWRLDATNSLISLLRELGIESAVGLRSKRFGNTVWDFVCRWDKK